MLCRDDIDAAPMWEEREENKIYYMEWMRVAVGPNNVAFSKIGLIFS